MMPDQSARGLGTLLFVRGTREIICTSIIHTFCVNSYDCICGYSMLHYQIVIQ